jgi:hypothetical protein
MAALLTEKNERERERERDRRGRDILEGEREENL